MSVLRLCTERYACGSTPTPTILSDMHGKDTTYVKKRTNYTYALNLLTHTKSELGMPFYEAWDKAIGSKIALV